MIPAVDTLSGAALLDQESLWRSWGDQGQLVTLLVDNMTASHRAETLAWLRAHAQLLLDLRKDSVARLHKRGLLDDETFAEELAYLAALDPHVWLEDRPLVRRLVQLVPRPEPLPRRGFLKRWRHR